MTGRMDATSWFRLSVELQEENNYQENNGSPEQNQKT